MGDAVETAGGSRCGTSYCHSSFGEMLTTQRFTLVDCLVPSLGPFWVMSTIREFFG